jgi:hypothetical protein
MQIVEEHKEFMVISLQLKKLLMAREAIHLLVCQPMEVLSRTQHVMCTLWAVLAI